MATPMANTIAVYRANLTVLGRIMRRSYNQQVVESVEFVE
jgi:hypothetical protein